MTNGNQADQVHDVEVVEARVVDNTHRWLHASVWGAALLVIAAVIITALVHYNKLDLNKIIGEIQSAATKVTGTITTPTPAKPKTNITVPYECVLTVSNAIQVDAEDPYNGDWRRDKSYVRILVVKSNGKERGVRIPAVIESPNYTLEHYKRFKTMANKMKPGAMVRIHNEPSSSSRGSALEPGMIPLNIGKVWVQTLDGTNDIIVPVTRISILKVRDINK